MNDIRGTVIDETELAEADRVIGLGYTCIGVSVVRPDEDRGEAIKELVEKTGCDFISSNPLQGGYFIKAWRIHQ